MKKISIIAIDSKIPNIALMKLSAYHKSIGDEVRIGLLGNSDLIYVSCIFTWNRPKAEALLTLYPDKVVIGGPGWNLHNRLPDEIEGITPDYDLYGINFGIGFTSRGCIRKCGFCIVPEKEGRIRSVVSIPSMVNPRSKFLVLLDNNFLANPEWEARIEEIYDLGLTVNFNQGLDIRLINHHNAWWLSKVRIANYNQTKNYIYFAFDDIRIETQVRGGVEILKDAGIKPSRLRFYILCGYNSTFEEDVYRFNVIRELGAEPFIQLYNKGGDLRLALSEVGRLRHFSRWVNRQLYKVCKFEEYRRWARAKGQLSLF